VVVVLDDDHAFCILHREQQKQSTSPWQLIRLVLPLGADEWIELDLDNTLLSTSSRGSRGHGAADEVAATWRRGPVVAAKAMTLPIAHNIPSRSV